MYRAGRSIIDNVECFVVEEDFLCTAFPVNAQNERLFSQDLSLFAGGTTPQHGKFRQTAISCEDITEKGLYRLYLPTSSSGAENVQFVSPIILTGRSPFPETTRFVEIRFIGGAVDFVKQCGNITYNKPDSISLEDGSNIDLFWQVGFIDDSSEYCFDVNIFGTNAKLKFGANAKNALNKNGEICIHSFLSIAFEQPQHIDDYESMAKYLIAVINFLSFLIGQRNISFSKMEVLYTTGGDGLQVAEFEYNSMYNEVCNRGYSDQTILKIEKIKTHTPKIFELFFDDSVAPWIQFLPERNDFLYHIYGHTLTDIIAAAQKEAKLNRNINTLRNNTKNVKRLYQRYANEIASTLPNFCEPIIHKKYDKNNKDDIDKFVDVRNEIQHSGIVSIDERMKIFMEIKCALYLSVFERAGIEEADRKAILFGWKNYKQM
ncbi:MAG: hypothetical protein PHI32_09280 [Dysgonamonadaceae bacterium]|nr:hypothetical protein [Dysgonamonadaceae bacterium]